MRTRAIKQDLEFGFRKFNLVMFIFNLFFLKFLNLQSAIRNIIKILISIFITLSLGCGYQLVGRETHVPSGINSVAIPTFVNKTFEPGIEVPITQAFLKEFIKDRRVKVVGRSQADSVLEGVIKSFAIYSISYDPSNYVLEYLTTIVIDLTLRKRTGEVLWVEKDVTEKRYYRVSSNVLINEANKAMAIQEIGKLLAERIRNRFFYQF